MSLEIHDVSVDLGGAPILSGVNLAVERGEFVGLLGPNGSGKSTLLRTIYRAHRPRQGCVLVEGDDLRRLRPREVARRIAAVLQRETIEFDYSAWEMVMLGRGPHKGPFERERPHDREVVMSALRRVGADHLTTRSFLKLSGGEQQRILIARALAQEATYVVLDEPTNHLDVRYQFEVLDLLRSLEVTVLAVLHDLNLAAAYCDRIYVMDRGRIHYGGDVDDVLDADMIRTRFGVEAAVIAHPISGRRQVMFNGPKQIPDGRARTR